MRSTPDKRGSEARALFDSAEGTVIAGHYKVESILGGGGMSIVYKCSDIVVGRTVALKIMQPQLLSDERWHARFLQEARTVGRLNHPGIVKLHEFNFIDDVPYIVMDFIEGVSLAGLIAQIGTMSGERALRIVAQIADALEHAHQHEVVHRDLKPSNIVVRKDDSPVIVDFGIAKVNASNMQVAATQTGEVFGSPAYMSPEQINGTVVDARADQYALGCILFECLTGAPPFVGDSAVEIMLAHRDREPASLQEASLGKTFPQGLELMVQRMLAKEPQQRFPDMSAVKQSLSAALDPTVGPNGSGRSSGSKSKGDSADKAMTRSTAASKNKLAPLVGLLIVLLLGIGTIFYSVNQDAGRKPQPEQTKTAVSPQSASNAVMPASIKESLDVTNMNLWVGRMRGFEGKRVLDTLAVDGLDEHGLDAPSIKRALTDEAILSIPKQPNAKKIDFSSCPHVTGTGLTRQGGDNIKTLNLDNCGITDDGLKSLNKFPNLQNLYLDATKITDKGMESLALFVPHLKVLTISSDSKLTGDCLNAVAKLHNLTQLEARSTNIAAGFKHFQQTKLEDLQIGGSNISDEDLQVLSAIKTLKVIGVSGCDITDHGLDHLSRLKLTSIDLTNCRRVTKGGIRSFEAQEAHCRITQ